MKTRLTVALLFAAAFVASPAFASGYGPAPAYSAANGAPASQRGQSIQTLTAEQNAQADSTTAYGGVATGHVEAGSHHTAFVPATNLFAHH
jgi:hypothetical protein